MTLSHTNKNLFLFKMSKLKISGLCLALAMNTGCASMYDRLDNLIMGEPSEEKHKWVRYDNKLCSIPESEYRAGNVDYKKYTCYK